jgi:hypothetical protein
MTRARLRRVGAAAFRTLKIMKIDIEVRAVVC